MISVSSVYNELVRRLNKLRLYEKFFGVATGSFYFAVLSLVVGLSVLALESVFHFSPLGRGLCLSLGGIFLLMGFVYFVGKPLHSIFFKQSYPDDITLALKVGEKLQDVRDQLADALQVFKKHQKNTEGYSLDLADASLGESYERVKMFDFGRVIDKLPLQKAGKIFFSTAVVFIVIVFISASTLTDASYRLMHPTVQFVEDLGFQFEVFPGTAETIKGSDLELRAQISGTLPSQVALFVKNEFSEEFHRYKLNPSTAGSVTYNIEDIGQSKEYYFEFDKIRSDNYLISVIERPLIRTMQISLNYPRYSKMGTQFLDENVGDISALRGTKVNLSLGVNKEVSTAKIIFSDSTETPLRLAGQELSGSFEIGDSGSYHIHLVDRKKLENTEPIEYRISMIEDQHPAVEITFPAQDVDLNKDMQLPMSVEAQDDYGISKARLGYEVLRQGIFEQGQKYMDLSLEKKNADKLLLNFIWDLSRIKMEPEDIVTYFVEVFDNDDITGPKSSRSLSYRVRFPSIYELYDEVARDHEEAFEELGEIYEDTKELKEGIDEIVQEMKRDPRLNWEEKKEIQESAAAQSQMEQELEQLQEKLENMVDRMEQNDLVSPEVLDKYRELQSLVEEMMTEEMKETLEKLQESMEDLNQNELKKTMEDFAETQEEFLKSMERTLNLLKKLQIEQKLDEAVRKAQDLARRQDELNEQMAKANSEAEREKYSREQNRIQKDAEGLKKDMEDLQKRMSEFPQMPQDKMDVAQDQMSNDGPLQDMQNAQNQMKSGQMQSAQQSGQKASKGMQQVSQALQEAQEQLSEEQKQKIMQALKRSSHDLLNLSKRQEELMSETKGADRNTPGLGELADDQQNMMSGLNRVSSQMLELSKNTFFVTPEIAKALGKAQKGMQESLQNLEGRKPGKSGKNQKQAMSGLNDAAAQVRSSMQGMQGASSGIGFGEMMQRMLGLSQQQQGINQQSQGMGEQGRLSMQQQAALSRLSAEQGAVQKALEQLMKESGSQSDLLGDMGSVTREMEEVVKEMQANRLNQSTINKQKKILSRLLDAQRSIQTRDFSKKRKAETAKNYQAFTPAELPMFSDQKKERLRNDLLKAMKEGYTEDYKELIQKYFEALAAEQNGERNN